MRNGNLQAKACAHQRAKSAKHSLFMQKLVLQVHALADEVNSYRKKHERQEETVYAQGTE